MESFINEQAFDLLVGLVLLSIALIFPARVMQGKLEFNWDLAGLAMLMVSSIFFGYLFEEHIDLWLLDSSIISNWNDTAWQWKWWILLPLNIIVADFVAYWGHRLLHTGWVWHTHAWHHSPKYLYFLSGIRSTPLHILVFFGVYSLVYIFIPIPDIEFILIAVLMLHTVSDHLIHSNIRLPYPRQIEYLIVTPRYHFVHHSTNRDHSDSNYGFIFTCWDHIFGTYTDPDFVPQDQPLGLGYDVSNWRLLLGLPPSKRSTRKAEI